MKIYITINDSVSFMTSPFHLYIVVTVGRTLTPTAKSFLMISLQCKFIKIDFLRN